MSRDLAEVSKPPLGYVSDSFTNGGHVPLPSRRLDWRGADGGHHRVGSGRGGGCLRTRSARRPLVSSVAVVSARLALMASAVLHMSSGLTSGGAADDLSARKHGGTVVGVADLAGFLQPAPLGHRAEDH